jgi:hypothetical protein
MPDVLRETFVKSIDEALAAGPDLVGEFPGFEPYPLIRLDDWIQTRILEAVVHSLDITDVLQRDQVTTPAGRSMAADLLDALAERTTLVERPGDLGDDLGWIRAASGRSAHSDSRLPLLR